MKAFLQFNIVIEYFTFRYFIFRLIVFRMNRNLKNHVIDEIKIIKILHNVITHFTIVTILCTIYFISNKSIFRIYGFLC